MKWKIKEQFSKIPELMSARVGVLIHVCLLQRWFCVPMSPVPQSSNIRTSHKTEKRHELKQDKVFCSVSLCDKKMEERGLPPSIPVFAEGPQPPPWANSEGTHWTTKDGTHSFHYLPGQESSPAVGGRQLEDQSQLPSKNHAQYIAQDHMPCCGVLERARSPTYTGKRSEASWAGIPWNGSWLIDFPERKRHKLWSQGRWGR